MRTASLERTIAGSRQASSVPWQRVGYVLTDSLLVVVNALVVFYVRFVLNWLPRLLQGRHYHPYNHDLPPLDQYLGFLLLYAALIVLFCHSYGLYPSVRAPTALEETLTVIKAVGMGTLILTAFIYLSGVESISRIVVGVSGALDVATLSGWRFWKRIGVEHRVAEGNGARNALIIGAGKVGQNLARYLDENKHLGIAVKGFLDQNHGGDSRVLGSLEDLSHVARAKFIDEIFVTIPSRRELVKSISLEARLNHLDVKVVPDLYDGLGWKAPVEYLGDFPVMALHREPIPVLGLMIKRTIDLLFSFLALPLMSPVLAAIALAIKLDSKGPAFYLSARLGRKGCLFTCYKFRTMVADADALKKDLRHLNQREGPTFKILNDPRLTRVGRFLRKHSLDELPQLWNVFKGDMSLVGPRPHPLDDCNQYSLEHLRRLDVTPGISGLWQVSARRDPSFDKNRELDLEYIENWDLWLDLRILLRTIPVLFREHGE